MKYLVFGFTADELTDFYGTAGEEMVPKMDGTPDRNGLYSEMTDEEVQMPEHMMAGRRHQAKVWRLRNEAGTSNIRQVAYVEIPNT